MKFIMVLLGILLKANVLKETAAAWRWPQNKLECLAQLRNGGGGGGGGTMITLFLNIKGNGMVRTIAWGSIQILGHFGAPPVNTQVSLSMLKVHTYPVLYFLLYNLASKSPHFSYLGSVYLQEMAYFYFSERVGSHLSYMYSRSFPRPGETLHHA